MNNVKIGFTDLADPFYDRSWVEKLDSVIGAIVISKGLGHDDQEFENLLLQNQKKIIFHCTITGFGGTDIEPGVPDYQKTLNSLQHLIEKGFDPNHIVIRIDPIIGSQLFRQVKFSDYNFQLSKSDGLKIYQNIVDTIIMYSHHFEISRIRYSYLDLYQHSRSRLEELGYQVPTWAIDFNEFENWKNFFLNIEKLYPKIKFGSCAEKFVPEHHKIGCLSKKDFEILGLNPDDCTGKCQQRKMCMCAGNKVELLKYSRECPHKCAYCYIKN